MIYMYQLDHNIAAVENYALKTEPRVKSDAPEIDHYSSVFFIIPSIARVLCVVYTSRMVFMSVTLRAC